MRGMLQARSLLMGLLTVLVVVGWLAATSSFAADTHMSKPFTGTKVNGGTVTHAKQGGKNLLTLSDDFQVPGTPDPHWQVVDSQGNVYLLQRLMIKEDRVNKTITLPSYIRDIAKVQIWCAWAETLLGEAPFSAPIMARAK